MQSYVKPKPLSKQDALAWILAGELLPLFLRQFFANDLFSPTVTRWPRQTQRLYLHLAPSAFWRAVLHKQFVGQFHGL